MRTKHSSAPCDPDLLLAFLEQRLTSREEAALERHLETCAACRQQINEAAAEPDLWIQATQFLKPDKWDEAAGSPQDLLQEHPQEQGSHVAAAGRAKYEDGIVLHQLKDWLDPTDDPQFLGRFGGYEIVGVIGHGGMAMVLKGFERSLNRYVAIKVLSPALASSGAARKRFSREARAAAAVLHENVIAIHRVADAHHLPYLVMPYVGATSLQKRLDEDGPLPVVAILRISRQIAAGLAAAHAQGLVHRDIKPANILLERGVERVVITDFGLARAVDDASVTKTGVIAGTPQYMSPEQARGEPIDARSDLFSLGSVMYAMCTGHPPFRADTSYGILRRITDGQPRPVRDLNNEIPPWLAVIIERLHAKLPGQRIESAEELAQLLEQCLAHLQQPAVSPLPPPISGVKTTATKKWLYGAMVAATLTAVIAGMGLLQSGRRQSAGTAPLPDTASNKTVNGDHVELDFTWNDGVAKQLQQYGHELPQLEQRTLMFWEFDP